MHMIVLYVSTVAIRTLEIHILRSTLSLQLLGLQETQLCKIKAVFLIIAPHEMMLLACYCIQLKNKNNPLTLIRQTEKRKE
jgi:hypothetical protein